MEVLKLLFGCGLLVALAIGALWIWVRISEYFSDDDSSHPDNWPSGRTPSTPPDPPPWSPWRS